MGVRVFLSISFRKNIHRDFQFIYMGKINFSPELTFVMMGKQLDITLVFPGLSKSFGKFDLIVKGLQPTIDFGFKNIRRNGSNVYHLLAE